MYCILYVCIYIYICIWLNSDKSTCIYNGVSGLYFWLVSPNYTNDSQPHPPILDLGPSAPVDSWNKDSSRHGSATIPQMLQSPSVVNVATREKNQVYSNSCISKMGYHLLWPQTSHITKLLPNRWLIGNHLTNKHQNGYKLSSSQSFLNTSKYLSHFAACPAVSHSTCKCHQIPAFLCDIQIGYPKIPWIRFSSIWVCLKIGYIPNYSHLIGIMMDN